MSEMLIRRGHPFYAGGPMPTPSPYPYTIPGGSAFIANDASIAREMMRAQMAMPETRAPRPIPTAPLPDRPMVRPPPAPGAISASARRLLGMAMGPAAMGATIGGPLMYDAIDYISKNSSPGAASLNEGMADAYVPAPMEYAPPPTAGIVTIAQSPLVDPSVRFGAMPGNTGATVAPSVGSMMMAPADQLPMVLAPVAAVPQQQQPRQQPQRQAARQAAPRPAAPRQVPSSIESILESRGAISREGRNVNIDDETRTRAMRALGLLAQ